MFAMYMQRMKDLLLRARVVVRTSNMKISSCRLAKYFSNSLIIHEEKTKEITTVKEVWICDPNYHKIQWTFALIFSKNYQCFEKLYQTLERVFHLISGHFEVGWKNSAAPRFFGPLLSVWMSDEALFLVFDILRQSIAPKSVPQVKHDYFSTFNQSNHWFVVFSLPLPSSNLKLCIVVEEVELDTLTFTVC